VVSSKPITMFVSAGQRVVLMLLSFRLKLVVCWQRMPLASGLYLAPWGD
jgi:hypothetical protein